ncbi:MAG: 2-hydroxy-6-oxohepta-2,4-dienoate hydrolase [Sulfurovum sp. AS07-7]|nr:MAG: 2-hydroxy-6-oxohepta-2,4-dienoate hydrolase [Sulfurovum sp. AS07-7]
MAQREIIYDKNKFSIAYDIVNLAMEDCIVILHGWGSNKEIMKQAFAKQMSDLKHIYIDMPGFGKSTNPVVLTTDDYARILQIFFDDIGIKPLMIAGHSFGGKVATLLNPACLILLSSAGILVPKPFSVRAKIAAFKILKPLGFGKMRRFFASRDVEGMSHEMYETFKNVVNEDFSGSFAQFEGDALLFWGKSDTATPLWTAQKINSIIKRSKLYPLEGDHYFFLKHSKFISDTIMQYYKEHK